MPTEAKITIIRQLFPVRIAANVLLSFGQAVAISMDRALKTLRFVQWALLGSVVLYVGLGAAIRPVVLVLNPTISYLFTTFAVAVIGAIFVVRRTMVFRAAASLADQPADLLSLKHWMTGFIVTYALCEMLGLLGLVQHLLGGTLPQSGPYFLGAFILLIFFWPRQPIAI